jgi:hypothetical protein
MRKEHRGGHGHWKGGDKDQPTTNPSNPNNQ